MGSIVLFDGVCNLCNASVNFIIRRDSGKVFKFASLQSEAARSALEGSGLPEGFHGSVVLVEDGKVMVRSDAAIAIAGRLGFPWSWFAAFKLVPRPVRDLFYDTVARSRYRVFGKRDECMMPTPETRERFLD